MNDEDIKEELNKIITRVNEHADIIEEIQVILIKLLEGSE